MKSPLKIPPDKWKHIIVGILMGIVFLVIVHTFFSQYLVIGYIISFLLIAGIGYGFELFSLFTGLGHYDFMDAVATIVGGLVGIAIALSGMAVI